MPGRSPIDLLMYEASRRPHIKDLVERAHDLSDEEIKAAIVPLPWYRKALTQLRDARNKNKNAMISQGNQAALMAPFIRNGHNADPEGIMCIYNGDTRFITMGKTSIEVHTNTFVFFPRAGGVWIDTAFCGRIDPNLQNYCAMVGPKTRMGYMDHIKAVRSGLIGQASEAWTPETANGARGNPTLERLGVRFG